MNPHSAIVEMYLCVGGHTYKVNQMGGDFLILGSGPITKSGPFGWLTVIIDGHSTTRKVLLPSGVWPEGERTPIAKL